MSQSPAYTVHRRSALEAIACPHRYKRIVIDGVPDGSPEADRGSWVHEAARRYVLALAERHERSDYDLARECLADAIAVVKPAAAEIDDGRDVFLRWAERFELERDAFLLAEVKQSSGVRTWTPDLVYARQWPGGSELEIVDFKTHYVGVTETQARTLIQPKFYVVEAARAWPGFARYRFTFEWMRLSWQTSVVFEPSDLPELEESIALLERLAAAHRAEGVFPAKPGPHCAYCRLVCPLERALVEAGHVERLTRLEDAVAAHRMGEELIALQRGVDTRRELLAGWAALHGPIMVQGVELSYRESTTTTYPLRAVLVALGEPAAAARIDAGVALSATQLRAYLKTRKWREYREAIESCSIEERKWSFTSRVPGRVRRRADSLDAPEGGQA